MINRYRFPLFISTLCLACLSSVLPAKGEVSLIETAQKSLPAIVSVTAEIVGVAPGGRPAAAIDKATGRMIILRNVKAAYLKRVGAGVIIDPSGLIATNTHTIANAQKVTVTLNDGTQVAARIVQYFPEEDFALLSINPPYPLLSIELADSDNIRLGEEVITVGNSELLSQTISGGKIIGIGSHNHQKQDGVNTDMIQINMNVYKGDSGGPLLNRDGQLLGLIVASQADIDRSSFAIPSKKIRMHYLEYLRSLSGGKNKNSP